MIFWVAARLFFLEHRDRVFLLTRRGIWCAILIDVGKAPTPLDALSGGCPEEGQPQDHDYGD